MTGQKLDEATGGVAPSYLVDRGKGQPVLDVEFLASLADETTREITREALRLPDREKRIVRGIVRELGEGR